MDGLEGNRINGKQTYLSAPLCLLHLNQQGQVVPIAIQVSSPRWKTLLLLLLLLLTPRLA